MLLGELNKILRMIHLKELVYKIMAYFYNNWNIKGDLAKEDDRYEVYDNANLHQLIVSKTILKPYKSTTGHRHKGQEEVYIFVQGNALMEIEHNNIQKIEEVTTGSIVLIEDNDFHRVHNKTGESVEFVCVFNGERSH